LGEQLQAIPAALRSQSVISQGPAVLALSCGIVLGSVDRDAKAILLAFAERFGLCGIRDRVFPD
jgi:hypothetical protein